MLYIFVEIAIDSSHLEQTVRLNFPSDRQSFHEALLDHEDADRQLPAGTQLLPNRHLRIEGPLSSESNTSSATDADHQASSRIYEPTRLALVSTIQFVAALSRLKDDLTTDSSEILFVTPTGLIEGDPSSAASGSSSSKYWSGKYDAVIPRAKPLSPGELLGCTAPRLTDVDALM